MTTPAQQMEALRRLASEAAPQPTYQGLDGRDSRDDWGSRRQIKAENDFYDAVVVLLDDAEDAAFDRFCHKATTDERIAEGLRLAAIKLGGAP